MCIHVHIYVSGLLQMYTNNNANNWNQLDNIVNFATVNSFIDIYFMRAQTSLHFVAMYVTTYSYIVM